MENRIDETFRNLRADGKTGFIPFLMPGYPDIETIEKLILQLSKNNIADIIELGIPFSDPIADGPIIQSAGNWALKKGIKTDDVFKMIKKLRTKIDLPLVIMTYYNIVFKYGIKIFFRTAKNAGLDGLIIADLPPEEAEEPLEEAKKNDIDLIFLVSPTSNEKRIKLIIEKSKGFIYFVSRTGTTGIRENLSTTLRKDINKIKRWTEKPIAVGFGISTPSQVQIVSKYCDAVIVGSAIINDIAKNIKSQKTKLINYILRKWGYPKTS